MHAMAIWPMAHGMMHDARVRDCKYFKLQYSLLRSLPRAHPHLAKTAVILCKVAATSTRILDRRLYAYAYASHGIATLSRTAGFAFDASCFNDSRSVQRRAGLAFAEAYSYTQTARDD